MSAGGGTPTSGRQLPSWALKAGAEPSQVTLSYSTSSYRTPSKRRICSQGLCAQLRGGGMRKALKFGLGADEEFEEMAKAWEEWEKRDDASLAMLYGEFIIQK
ncbi:hypothetical protein GGR53DRAFT_322904 [Hypoxylon sp. FL1150]|nr:hypothetical protein GGR53DRAFT_322904 [Hypoxylon sp. FL1150]